MFWNLSNPWTWCDKLSVCLSVCLFVRTKCHILAVTSHTVTVTRYRDSIPWLGTVTRYRDSIPWLGTVTRYRDSVPWLDTVTRYRDSIPWLDTVTRYYTSKFTVDSLANDSSVPWLEPTNYTVMIFTRHSRMVDHSPGNHVLELGLEFVKLLPSSPKQRVLFSECILERLELGSELVCVCVCVCVCVFVCVLVYSTRNIICVSVCTTLGKCVWFVMHRISRSGMPNTSVDNADQTNACNVPASSLLALASALAAKRSALRARAHIVSTHEHTC